MDVIVVVVVVLEPTARTTASSGDPKPRGTQPVREDDAKNQARPFGVPAKMNSCQERMDIVYSSRCTSEEATYEPTLQ